MKAGFRTSVCMIVLTMACLTASASTPLQCAVVILNQAGSSAARLADRYRQSLVELLPQVQLSATLAERLRVKETEAAYKALLAAAHAEIAKNGGDVARLPAMLDAESDNPESDTVECVWKLLEIPDGLVHAVEKLDPIALDYLVRINAADVVFVLRLQPFDEFTRIRLSCHGLATGESTLLFDRIQMRTDPEVSLGALSSVTATYLTGTSHGMLLLSSKALSIEVLVDGSVKKQSVAGILLETGLHTVAVQAAGYEGRSYTVSIEKDQSTTLEVVLSPIEQADLVLFSPQGSARSSIAGLSSISLPYAWDAVRLPSAVTTDKAGFATNLFFITKADRLVALELKPAWMENPSLVLHARDPVYGSLGRTILLTGMAVLMHNIPFAFGSNAVLSVAMRPAVTAFAAAAGVSLFDTLWRLFDYSTKTQYSSL
jgi:hypothetical protein